MKILLYSHYFYPSIGGLESVSLTLAKAFVQNGIECKVITTTDMDAPDNLPFAVVRNPKWRQQIELIFWADAVLYNGASLAMQPWVLLFRKPFIWIHTGYQVSCIDGCGWVEGEKAPLTPVSSFFYHIKRNGIKEALLGGFKLFIKRIFAKHLVSRNVAITQWMLNVQPLPRQVHIYNPFPIDEFLKQKDTPPEYDFLYLGRLVSEKGVETLLRAFSEALPRLEHSSQLLIIGDGNWKAKMEDLAKELQISTYVTFAGRKSGDELVEYVSKGKIAIIPSEWYEPMGGVALELMAAGKGLIVSELGGLKECVGNAGLTFPNSDYKALANRMVDLLQDVSLRETQINSGKEMIKNFLPSIFISQYIDLLHKEIEKKQGKRRLVIYPNLET
jgi:glycosyltransferase involved in cell wall biosynthesis